MDGYGGGGNNQGSSINQDLPTSPGNAVFDASQYAFFGGDAVEEVELGGLEDEDDDLAPPGFDEEEILLEKEEGDVLGTLSEIDDLSSTFSELNKVVSGSTMAGASRDWGSRESLFSTELALEVDFPNWFDQRASGVEAFQKTKQWSSNQYSSSPNFIEPRLLHRTSSYPDQQQQNLHHQHSSEPILIRKALFTSYPFGGISQHASPNDRSSQANVPYYPLISSPNLSHFSNSQPRGPQFGGSLPQMPNGLPVNNRLQNQWVNQRNLNPGNQSSLPNNFSSRQNGLLPSQLMPPQHSQQTRLQHPFQPSLGRLAGLPPSQLSPSSSMINDFDVLGLQDLKYPRPMLLTRSRQGMHHREGPDFGNQKFEGAWPRFKSKYMSPGEIENILRMQLAATHSSNPYVDDYYHQACLARKSSGAKVKHHFCPIFLRDSSSKPRSSNDPHTFLQVDALGRVSFPSIRRPRPLLEVDSPITAESKLSEKPLEQEPMLVARVTIEDGLSLLLDVDDIDRYIQFNQLLDGGAHLKQKRQALLEGLASSLHLVDPLGKNGDMVNSAPKDDFVFLRIICLPKGWKLLLRYIQLLLPGELTRVVSMAIFRNLRLLFGNPPTDSQASLTNANLAKTISKCVQTMELKSLAACLISVVCSSEQPPMRPIGNPAGDRASIILKSVLDRATELLTNPSAAGNCTAPNRAFWQASFDAFFGLLANYCFNKYNFVVQSFVGQGSSDVAKAISREMPVELLRASLPHTNEQQRKLLLEFAQRSMPVLGFSDHVGGKGNL